MGLGLINILIFLIQTYHITINGLLKQYRQIFNVIFLLLISIMLVRYNIVNSIHNFVDGGSNQYVYYIVVLLFTNVVFLLLYMDGFFKNIVIFLTKTILLFFVCLFVYNIYIIYFIKIKNIIYFMLMYSMLLFLAKKYNIKQNGLFYLIILQNFFFVNILLFFCVKQILKNTILYRWEHLFLLLILYFLNHQVLLFNFMSNLYLFPTTTQIKISSLGGIDFLKTNIDLFKQKSFLENIINQKSPMYDVFEKIIFSKNTKEFYNYDNQYVRQVGFCILYVSFFVLFVLVLKNKKYINKEHRFCINI